MTPEERVRRLIASGSVAPEEGERLLAAMRTSSATGSGEGTVESVPSSRLALLLDPFEQFGGGTAAALGAIVSALSLVLSRLGVHFDGLLDLHFNRSAPPSLRIAVVEQIAAWIVPALVFWGYARTQTRHVRVVDFVGAVGLARLPLLIAGLVLLPLAPSHVTLPVKPTPSLLALAFLTIGFAVANITLLYKGFKNASGLTGMKLVGGFIGLLIAGEALSKVVILILS